MIASMSKKGDCWDNAPTERFFRSLKSERLSDRRFATRKMPVSKYLTASHTITLTDCIRLWDIKHRLNLKRRGY